MKSAAIFAFASTVAVVAATPLSAQPSDSIAVCDNIADARARLACYDWARRTRPPASRESAAPGGASLHDFGWRGSTSKIKRISAGVEGYSINRQGKFIVVLDNGQTWRQFNDDVGKVKFKDDLARNRVTITHGFWESYNLKLNAMNAEFRVERIK